MTYDNDGRLRTEAELRARNGGPKVRSNTGTIIGGLAVLAIILAVIFMLPHRTDTAAVNGQPTSTTGSGAATPSGAVRPAPPATPGAPAVR